MTRLIRYPLGPMDYVLLAKHESLQRRGYCGLPVILVIEASGPLSSDSLRAAVQRVSRSYPALSATIRYLPILHQPQWQIESDATFDRAIEYEYHRANSDDHSSWQPLVESLDEPIDLARCPHLRLTHVEIGEQRHRIGLRWAHPLMDMEGGHLLLGAIAEELGGPPIRLGREPSAMHGEPFRCGAMTQYLRAWKGRALYARFDHMHQPRIVAKPEGESRRCRFVVRHYDAPRRQAFETNAAQRTSTGPLRYSRAILISLARAYRTMASQRGRPRPRYMFTLPLPTPRDGPRPGLHGNYVTIPFVLFESAQLDDWKTADEALIRQFHDYAACGHDAAMWSMYRAAARWPMGFTSRLTAHRRPRLAAAFTGYQFDKTVTQLGQALITRLSAAGPADCHPGWLLGRMTYLDTMSLSITHFEDYFDSKSVDEFFDLLERELFG